ncbi:YkoP family protein [Priestia endophytica]|uniref:YkoP family protein n=1 Tax=Priestia endophytica TaxID=135735 RepID=UPI00227FF440|nr:hypothetical protein [Priestia endophytica]MCY8235084.1 hypothetical protein [Priestia endophytica]
MKRIVLYMWMVWENLYYRLFRLQMMTGNELFLFKPTMYHGNPLYLSDGNIITEGDAVLELHFNNRKLLELLRSSRSSFHLAKLLITSADYSLKQLCSVFQSPSYQQVKALYGVSILYRGAYQYGFLTYDLPKGLITSIKKRYLQTLLCIFHPLGYKRLTQRRELLVPKLIIISSEEFRKRYDHE